MANGTFVNTRPLAAHKTDSFHRDDEPLIHMLYKELASNRRWSVCGRVLRLLRIRRRMAERP
jgi:hypothetical protein